MVKKKPLLRPAGICSAAGMSVGLKVSPHSDGKPVQHVACIEACSKASSNQARCFPFYPCCLLLHFARAGLLCKHFVSYMDLTLTLLEQTMKSVLCCEQGLHVQRLGETGLCSNVMWVPYKRTGENIYTSSCGSPT